MAKLTRPTETKIFGSTALAAELTPFGSSVPSTDINLILNSVEAQRGWGTIGANGFPPMEWFNALGYGLSYYNAYLMQQGIPEWTALQNYYINSYAVGSDGKLYRSKTGITGTPNVGNTPVGDTTNWSDPISDTASSIHTALEENPGGTDEFGYWDSFTQTLRRVSLTNLIATFKASFDTVYQAILVSGTTIKTINGTSLLGAGNLAVSSPTGVRQTIQTGAKDANGYCAITQTSVNLTLTLLASPTEPVTVHAWGGAINKDRWAEITANMTLSLPASQAAVYCYIELDANNTPTLGYTLLAPIYQSGGTISMVNGQFTCDISSGKCYVGVSGTSYVQVWRTFFQESVTSATAITSVVNYALNGEFRSADTIFTATTLYSFNNNIGTNIVSRRVEGICTVPNNNYLPGATIDIPIPSLDGAAIRGIGTYSSDRNTSKAEVCGGVYIQNATTPNTQVAIDFASWKFRMIVKRGF